jgi:hypothetical protein
VRPQATNAASPREGGTPEVHRPRQQDFPAAAHFRTSNVSVAHFSAGCGSATAGTFAKAVVCLLPKR